MAIKLLTKWLNLANDGDYLDRKDREVTRAEEFVLIIFVETENIFVWVYYKKEGFHY